MASYRVLVYEADTSNKFAVGDLVAEYENAKNVAYANYINDIGEAFWTVNQDDAKVNIRSHVGTAHVFIQRNDGVNEDVVWRGILTELDANGTDVIMYAYGYEHIMYHLFTPWGWDFKGKQLAGVSTSPINKLWSRAKTRDSSQLGFVTTGTIEAPVTETGGAVAIVLGAYKVFWKRILFAMKELTAIALSDTTNVCYMEIDYPKSPTDHSATFNYWKNRTTDRESVRLTKPGNVQDYSDRYVPIFGRNELWGVGTGARGQLYRFAKKRAGGARGAASFGRRTETIYLTWVRDRKELKRIVKRRLSKAMREDISLYVRMFPDTLKPARATGSGYNLGDRIRVKVSKGITNIDKLMFLSGEQVIWVSGREYVQPLVEDRGGV